MKADVKAALLDPGARKLALGLVVSVAGITSIAFHEGTVPKVYLDPINIPTVCTGHTATVTQADVGKEFSPAQCSELLKQDLRVSERAVRRLVTAPVTQAQYDALVSLTFNIGEGNLSSSSLLKLHNKGLCRAAAAQFDRWIYAGKQKLAGLIKRRAFERAQFEKDCS